MQGLIAQREIYTNGIIEGIGPLGLQNRSATLAPTLFNTFISTAIGLMTIIAAIWFTFNLITGAISIITSGGDKVKVTEARSRITMGLVGLVIIIAAMFIIELIGTLIGFDLVLNPAGFIRNLPAR
jgi:hypothetical protein